MRRLSTILFLILATLGSAPAANAAHHSIRLLIRPLQAHAGDTIYVSGSGFAPHAHLIVAQNCIDPGTDKTSGGTLTRGAVAGDRGRILAFRVRVPSSAAIL